MRISDWSSDVCSSDLKWVFWQVGHVGPMSGQSIHFHEYAPEDVPYGKLRYSREAGRLYAVLDRQLAGKRHVAGDAYTIADIAIYPWIVPHARVGVKLDEFPEVRRWLAEVRSEEHTSELQSLMRISYAVFCLEKKT